VSTLLDADQVRQSVLRATESRLSLVALALMGARELVFEIDEDLSRTLFEASLQALDLRDKIRHQEASGPS
jgi:hypothetical protein